MRKKDWIRDVFINPIAHNARVVFVGEHKNELLEAIEDLGFEVALDTVENLSALEPDLKSGPLKRTADVLVEGMFCESCPARALAALEVFGDKIYVEKALTTEDPILRLSYTPEVPNFTIRHIVSAIANADKALQASIYHPPSLEERSRQIHAREQQSLLIRLFACFIVAIPSLIIGIIYMSLVPVHDPGRRFIEKPLVGGISRGQWALFVIATPVYFSCADVFHKRAIKEVQSLWRKGSATPIFQRFSRFGSMNSLMSLGTSIAYISSVAQLIAAGVYPSKKTDNNSFYFDSVVFLTLFLLLGRLIESYSKSKTGDAVTMLKKMRPTEALLVNCTEGSITSTDDWGKINRSDSVTLVNVDLLELGDIVKIRHGSSPPCDGVVVHGESKFDESSLTGESRAVKKFVSDSVFSGTINEGTPVSIKITGVAGSSMLDHIVKAVREGQTCRAPIERIADTLTSYFVPCIFLTAIVTWAIWFALGCSGILPDSYMDHGSCFTWSLQFSIAVVVVACPCGLALAAPTALFVGGGLAAKHGILVKGGGQAFEKASRLDCLVFDKTGTLTVGGGPLVTDYRIPEDFQLKSLSTIDEDMILGFIHALEVNSSHTVAKAVVSFCRTSSMQDIAVEEIEEIPGKGMKGVYRDTAEKISAMIIGNESLMVENDVKISPMTQITLNAWKREGKSIALVAITFNNTTSLSPVYHLCASFSISDPIRSEAPSVIAALKKSGTVVWMLSGDNQITANAIGALVGIPSTNIIAGVLPHQKSERIKYLQRTLKASDGVSATERALVGMVGDGINDSPALTTADVGIAIGSGSDIAISSAEVVLITSNLNSLVTLLDLSRSVFRRIKFNFIWALIYNMIALPVAAGVLYPLTSHGTHVRLDPVWASLAMALSSISVVCSSLALRSRIPGLGFRVRSDLQNMEN